METGVLVCAHVLENTRPVLLAARADDEWQFLCGSESDTDRTPAVIGLNHLLERDPSLSRILDLPNNWEAERDDISSPWRAFPSGPEGTLTCGSLIWDEFLSTATSYLCDTQNKLKTTFELDTWERYDYDQGSAILALSSPGKAGIVADMHIVGSTSYRRGTWLWSWDNPAISPQAKRGIVSVREYGETHSFRKLTTAVWPGDDSDGWDMTAVAAFLLQTEGGYRIPHERGALFMVLQRVRWVE